RAAHRIDDARKLYQQAVASSLDEAAVMLSNFRIDEFPTQRLEAFERAFFIRPHQPRIARDIGSKDRGQAACLAHLASPSARRRPERYSSRCRGSRNGSG